MYQRIRQRTQGFTLVELAIVLAVAGLLFVGLWRLLAGGNQQVRDQSAASQQQQLISAVKGYLISAQGQTFMAAVGPNNTITLPLPATNPSNAVCQNDALLLAAGTPLFCNFLPAGFTNATPNSYGQTFGIRILKDGSAAGTPPNSYSFMVLTTGGDVIPDTSGGRISAFVGGDGGFTYSAAVCGAPAASMACGAYGTWSSNVTAYGFGVPAVAGKIATRTYVSPTADNTFPWLARPFMPGDNANTPLWNTMQTDLFLGNNIGTGVPNNFWLGSSSAAGVNTGGGTLNAQGGTINMVRTAATSGGGVFNMQGAQILDTSDVNQTGEIRMGGAAQWLVGTPANPMITLNTNCTAGLNPSFAPVGLGQTCQVGLQVNGDANVVGELQAYDLYAFSFIYRASDARYKLNIRPVANSLDSVMRLKPVSYTLKTANKETMGVVAQDVEKVYPQLVTDNHGMKAVDYDGLIAPLIGAVQELKHENDRLRRELDEQKARQEKFEEQLRHDAP